MLIVATSFGVAAMSEQQILLTKVYVKDGNRSLVMARWKPQY